MIRSYFYRLIQSKALQLAVSGSLLLSSTLPGVTSGFRAAKEAVTAYIVKLERLPQGPYTDRPQAAFLGAHPGRSETRGLWTADQIREHENEGLQASSEPAVNLMTLAS